MRIWVKALIVVSALGFAASAASAQDSAAKPKTAPPSAKPSVQPTPAQIQPAPASPGAAPTAAAAAPPPTTPVGRSPAADKLVLLVRTALLTLNDALQTGNYAVMRDRAAPSFQANTSAEKMAQWFAKHREQKLDLSFVAIAVPQLSSAPSVDDQKTLKVTGTFTGPVRLDFTLLFVPVDGHWRMSGIAINPVSSVAAKAPAAASSAPTPAKPVPTPAPAAAPVKSAAEGPKTEKQKQKSD